MISLRTVRWPVGLLLATLALAWTGCVPPAPVIKPPPPPPPVVAPPVKDLTSHLLGAWENLEKTGHPRQLVFAAGGGLTFKGGMEFFNPAQWELNSAQDQLTIRLPNADVDKLQIFQMSAHDGGVKAFHPEQKEIIYAFTEETFTLNVGGWTYTKADQAAPKAEEEPVLK